MSTSNKQRIELAKTIAIAVLVTALVAFIGGMQYQKHIENNIDRAVSAQVSKDTPVSKVK